MTARARWTIVAALLVAFVAGGSTVYLVGSSNRRGDREAVLRYEAAVTADVREMVVVAGSLERTAGGFGSGRITGDAFARYAREAERTLEGVAVRLASVRVPAPFGQGETMFVPAAREFARAAGLYASFAACARNTVGPSASCVATASATAAAATALDLYRDAVGILQRTRARLGLPRSPNFPLDLPR